MDAAGSYPLVVLPPEQGSLEPVPRQIILGGVPFDDESQADFVDLLQQAVALLCLYVLYLLSALRVLRLQVVDLRWRANYWRAQHQRARAREDDLKEQLELSQAQIRELERRLYGRKSETASATQPTSQAKSPPSKRKRGQQPGNKGPGRRNHDPLDLRPPQVDPDPHGWRPITAD